MKVTTTCNGHHIRLPREEEWLGLLVNEEQNSKSKGHRQIFLNFFVKGSSKISLDVKCNDNKATKIMRIQRNLLASHSKIYFFQSPFPILCWGVYWMIEQWWMTNLDHPWHLRVALNLKLLDRNLTLPRVKSFENTLLRLLKINCVLSFEKGSFLSGYELSKY